ncbi:type II toxin-antitoxin system HicA family toxin [Geobacter sp.]|uniref:type II toxin-antitoxin system HicA family toxin n=1 Tax=Geobacter sp. TaxID=46610 RepID=UPI00359FDAD4
MLKITFTIDSVCIGVYCAGGKGDHQKYKHPSKAGHVVVPHPRKDLPTGTLRNIFRQAGWEWR